MGLRIVRAGDLVLAPWKNGGGTTAEVAVDPPGSGLDTFDWRVSMANVATAGPFSTFPGVDRTLVLVEGESLDLQVDGITHRLDSAARVLSFPGEARTSAKLPSSPIRDLNVMTRRARFRHRVSLAVHQHDRGGTILVAVALDHATSIMIDGQAPQLDRLDVLIADPWPAHVISSKPMISIGLTRL